MNVESIDIFEELFRRNLIQLLKRANHLRNTKYDTLDYWTYYEMCLVQIRAMFIESPHQKKNYTYQNYLQKIGAIDNVPKLDQILEQKIIDEHTISECVKLSTDKFIVHNDDIGVEQLKLEYDFRLLFTDEKCDLSLQKVLYDISMILKVTLENNLEGS